MSWSVSWCLFCLAQISSEEICQFFQVMRSEVLTAVNIMTEVFWYVMLHSNISEKHEVSTVYFDDGGNTFLRNIDRWLLTSGGTDCLHCIHHVFSSRGSWLTEVSWPTPRGWLSSQGYTAETCSESEKEEEKINKLHCGCRYSLWTVFKDYLKYTCVHIQFW
jgi:hypothetical protein